MNAGRTRIEWLSQLNTEYTPARQYRRTSIIGTIGPKTNSPDKMNALRKAGLNVVRMNFSHGSYDDHRARIAIERQRVLLESRKSQERARNLREELARKAAEEAAARYGRE